MKINPIKSIFRQDHLKYEHKTPQERIDEIKAIRDGYPDYHSQIEAINNQISRIEKELHGINTKKNGMDKGQLFDRQV